MSRSRDRRVEVGAGIIFASRGNGDLTIQTSHAAPDINLADVSIGVGGVAIEGEEFRSFVGCFARTVDQDEVDDTGNGVRTVNGRGAIFQNLGAGKGANRRLR